MINGHRPPPDGKGTIAEQCWAAEAVQEQLLAALTEADPKTIAAELRARADEPGTPENIAKGMREIAATVEATEETKH